jgi:hypothetical protein
MNETDTVFNKDFTKNIKTKLKAKKAYNIDEMENEFKSKINFGDMLDKNYKDTESTPVSDLIKPTTQSIVEFQETSSHDEDLSKRIDNLEDRLQINSVNEKMERVEGLLQSVIINQQNLQHSVKSEIQEMVKDKLVEHKPEETKALENKEAKPAPNNKNIIAASILAIALMAAAFILAPSKPEPSKVTITKKEAVKAPITKTFKFVTTKFVNLRSKASTKAPVLFIVPPNSIVERLDHKQGWNKIKFTDHVKSASMTGWVYGENLKRLN